MSSLAPYQASGRKWSPREATHLLWRCAAGATLEEIERAVEDGMEKTVARLTTTQPESEEFTATEGLLHRSALDSGNINSLKNWWLYRLQETANPLAEKITLFWHNHFATSNAKVRSAARMDAQQTLIRKHALGRFDEMFRAMARDVAMLMWLDTNANRKRHPNENFAREVMELFSLGVGNYSETDIKEAARAFTGWHIRNGEFWFNKVQHDPGSKTVLGQKGAFKGNDILEICLAQKSCPRFLASKLLKTFVQQKPASADIDALAARIRHHKYAMAPVLQELLSSKLFYAAESRRSLIKSPVELVVGTLKALEVRPNLGACVQLMSDLGQNLFEPPTVKGWEGGRLWINSATLLQRANFAAQIASGEQFGKPTALKSQGSNRKTIAHFVDLLVAGEISKSARQQLLAHLQDSQESSSARLAGLVQVIMTMPEYQLI